MLDLTLCPATMLDLTLCLQSAAEAAFRAAGFDGFKYIERTFP